MMIGTIIGEISTAMISRRYGISGLDRPSAASVPRQVDRIVAQKPMITEFFAAFTQEAFCHMSPHQEASRGACGACIPTVTSASYQRREYPSGSSASIFPVKVK
ncbi:hypothetical protein XINFAN_00010 [Pseudogemmobacter humi]|uniref:Uncharacterized protein n=1 Tax=Pseudogemmobacter humi TaxID=2483812 RepID=A0A3P5WGN6_9RHOB|nr:hypothetical protein XINFAN_00010 [Pseudogemmobacter humi]